MADGKSKGLYPKYEVTRNDKQPVGQAIVLEFKDPIARVGILAWAEEMKKQGYEEVYKDVKYVLDTQQY